MIKLIIKVFMPKGVTAQTDVTRYREKCGVICGGVGIFLNVLLFVGKFTAGVLANSIAITSDAWNNLLDSGSSVISMIGFRLSTQKPDTKHPFGHGRFEYIAGIFVSFLILHMGVELGKTSIDKIIHPEEPVFSTTAVVILTASIAIKLYMAYYNYSLGKQIDSATLKATATDSLSDTVATFVTLTALIIFKVFGINADGWCGLAVSAFILYSGMAALVQTVSPLLGQPPKKELLEEIEKTVMADENVIGVHDIVVHDYGPGRMMISLHAEVDCNGDMLVIHDAIDNVERTLNKILGCESVIHIDPINTNDEATSKMRICVSDMVKGIDSEMSIHDFRMVTGPTHTNLIFDVVVPYEIKASDEKIMRAINEKIQMLDERYYSHIKIDRH